MKKILVAVLALVLTLSFTSCTTYELATASAAMDLASDMIDLALWPYYYRPLPPPPPRPPHCW